MEAGKTIKFRTYRRSPAPEGLGGAWGVKVTGAELNGDTLDIRYDLITAQDEVGGHGVMSVKMNADGSYRYLSNKQEEA